MSTEYDAAAALERIENELIDSMMRNLQRHLKEEETMGFDWSQWQTEQLRYLEEYRKKNAKKYGPQFSSINRRIKHAITHARASGQKEEELRILEMMAKHPELKKTLRKAGAANIQGGRFFKINEDKLDALVKATTNDMTRAEHAVLRRCNDQYRKIIFDAQMYANTGAGTIQKALDMATHDFLMRGIDCIEYKNGARHTISDYADMAIRTAERRATLMGAGETRKAWGEELVIVNRRGTMRGGNFGHACPLCIPWLGKVLIDDVYSGGKPDGRHQLVSTAMQQGFLHPRCKDTFTTYFPGISSVPDPATKKELKAGAEAEKEENRENYVERQTEKYERLAEYSLDPDNKRMYAARAEGWKEEVRKIKEYDSIQDAEAAARNMGVKYVEYGKLPKETANILNDAIETLPPEARPVFVGDSSTLEKYRGAKLPRKSSQFYGVTIDAQPDGLLLGNDPVTGRMNHDFDAQGDMIGISSKYNTPAKIEAAKKKSQEAYMAKHDGRKWYFNMNGEATIYHEMGHAYQDKFGLPEGFEADAMRWARESGCDMLKTPSEAFSEAWGAYHTGNPELPDYIAKYIEEASYSEMESKSIAEARSVISDIINGEDEAPPIKWPPRGERMGKNRNKVIRKYGAEKGIDIGGLADVDLSEVSAHEVIDDAAAYLTRYPELKSGRPSISFTSVYMNSSRSFAGTTNHLISINADAYRDLQMLEDEYQKLVKEHWFPKGTNHHALIAHEIGHVIQHHYPQINPIEIAMRISGKTTRQGLLEYVSENLSDYAAFYADGREIISECYACALTGVDNDFALKFVAECDKIIAKVRREAL